MQKLDIFADKKYESMEWLEQVISPFEFPLNEVLANIPKEYTLDFKDIMHLTKRAEHDQVSMMRVLQYLNNKLNLNLSKEFFEVNGSKFEEMFEMVVSQDAVLDLEENTLVGTVKFHKKVEKFENGDICRIMAEDFSSAVGWLNGGRNTEISRLNELMDVFDIKENRSSKSVRYKFDEIKQFMFAKLSDDAWRIRDYKLGKKMGTWFHDYIVNGNLAALNNIIRFKCMTHFNQPIYSVKEAE